MKRLMMIASMVVLAGMMSGCSTMSPTEQRAAYQEEYDRLASLPPARRIFSINRAVNDCGRLSYDLFNLVHPMMKAYVAKVETCREYTGFMNDVRYYVEVEKLSNQAACKKVRDAVIAADVNRPDDQKIWPKIRKGIIAANELDPKKQLVQIGVLVLRNNHIVKSVANLPKAFQREDYIGKAKRTIECAAISNQLADAMECLVFLGDQYSRVIELEHFAR